MVANSQFENDDSLGNAITSQQADAIGEILNISMGSAATAVSTMLDRQVVITTPQVSVRRFANLDLMSWEPAMLVTIKYIEGISGTNMMIFHKRDIQMIINMLMGSDDEPSDDFVFDELSMSAASEVMNQMMGSSATALSNFFSKRIDISTPEALVLETSAQFNDVMGISSEQDVAYISFKMTIDGVLDSEFINIMPIELAIELATQVLGDTMEEAAAAAPPQAPPQAAPPQAPPQAAPPQAPPPQAAPPQAAPPQAPPPQAAPPQAAPPQMPPEYAQQMYPPQPYPYGYPPQPYPPYPPQGQGLPDWAQPPAMNVKTPQFPDFTNRMDSAGNVLLNSNMDLMMGLPLKVSVEIGQTEKRIKDIMDFTQGTIIELEKQAGAPVDIIVNGHLIAHGDVVVIDDNFGVRITEIIRKNPNEL